MKARSETARTSRAAAPSAAPTAARAAPPRRIAASQRGKRHQWRGTNRARPASIRRVTRRPTATPRPTFSVSRAPREIRPRVSRGNAFSSRSSASEPATKQDDHEREDKGRGDGDRECVERRSGAADHLLVDLYRLRDAIDQRARDIEVVASAGGEADHLIEGDPLLRRQPRPDRGEYLGGGLEAENVDRLADAT